MAQMLGELTDDADFLELVNIVEHPRKPQTFKNRENHFIKWSDQEFLVRFRLSKPVVEYLIEKIDTAITPKSNRNHALTSSEMVFVTLRYFATGSILQVTGDFNGVDKSTASRVINVVTEAIARLKAQFIQMPHCNIETIDVRQKFYALGRFPRCIDALDCTHIKIQSPGGNEAEIYRIRKGFFSINTQVICDAELKIRNIVCRWPGASHDSHIFRNSSIRARFENGEFGNNLLLGDSGYGVKTYLITPLTNPQTPAEHLFNESQIKTRNVVERCFGVLKRRFPILQHGIRLSVNKVQAVVVATAMLHNIACAMKDVEPPEIEIEEHFNFAHEAFDNNPIIRGHNINNSTRYALINDYFQHMLMPIP